MQVIHFTFPPSDGDSTLQQFSILVHISRIFLHDSNELQGTKDTSISFSNGSISFLVITVLEQNSRRDLINIVSLSWS